LLHGQAIPSYGSRIAQMSRSLVYREPVKDAMTYHTQSLTQWTSLSDLSHTVWGSKSLWVIAARLWLTSTLVAVILVVSVPDPTEMDVGKFTDITTFLRVFVSLLLGFFMAASVKRWWACVEAFIGLCGTVRNLQMMLLACNAPRNEVEQALRYGVISAKLLHMELHVQALPSQEQAAADRKGWQDLISQDHDDSLAKLLPEEAKALQVTSDSAGTLWIWIGTYVGSLAARGHVRALAGPIFARCMVLSSQGLDKILRVRSCITVQAPFIYVHMLSSLVHISNITSAVSFGLTFGTVVARRQVANNVHLITEKGAERIETSFDLQALTVAFVFGAVGPLVYQALLEVSIAIAQPFSNSKALVPTERIVEKLVADLHDGMSCSFFDTDSSSHKIQMDNLCEHGEQGEDQGDDAGLDDGGAAE